MANRSPVMPSDTVKNPIEDTSTIKQSNVVTTTTATNLDTTNRVIPSTGQNPTTLSNTTGNNVVRIETPAQKQVNKADTQPILYYHPYTVMNSGVTPQNFPSLVPVPRGMHPQMYQPVQPYPIPTPFYGSHMYVPHPTYRPRISIQNQNGMIRPSYWDGAQKSSNPITSRSQKNETLNDEFINAIKKVHDSGASPKSKEVEVSTTTTLVNEKKPQRNQTSAAFADLLQSIPKPTKNFKEIKETSPAEPKESITIKTASTTEAIPTPKSSVNEASIEFHNIIKNVAHSDSIPFATCEYGSEVDGVKTYSIDEMLSIKSKMTYDIQKMVQTISKFRIAIKNQLSAKSENIWRSMAEKREMGLLTDKALFNHSLMQILNKITSVNFSQNFSSFKILKFTSSDLIKVYAQMLFDKVIGEHSWSYVYAELVKVTLEYFKETYSNDGYDVIFTTTLNEIIENGLQRDMNEEKAIIELKKVKTKDADEIDRLIAETAEREYLYRKNQFGVALFVSNLYYNEFIDQQKMDDILNKFGSYNDSFGIELYCFALLNLAHKYISDVNLKEEFLKRIDTLNDIITKDPKSITSKAKFAIMDLVKHKVDKFKDLPPRKKVSKVSETTKRSSVTTINVSNNAGMNGHESLKRNISIESNSLSSRMSSAKQFNQNRGRDSRFRGDPSDLRKVNPDAFNTTGRGKSFGKARGASVVGATSNMQRYAHYEKNFNVSLDDDNVTIPDASSVTSRTNLESKPISILKRPSDTEIKLTDNDKIPTNFNEKIKINNKPILTNNNFVQRCVGVETSSSIGKSNVLESQPSSIDYDNPKEADIKNLCESAQNLIINFHTKETNVSRFILELFNHALSDNMNIFLKEAFSYYSGVSFGHYIFGVLLVEMMDRQKDFIPLVEYHLGEYLVGLSLDALDEPVLWDYFFMLMLPILANNNFSFDKLHKLLSNTPDVKNPDEIIISMLELGEKRLAAYDVAKLVANQINTKFWERVTNDPHPREIVSNINKKLHRINIPDSNNYLHWVDIFLDVKYEESFVIQSFENYYINSGEGLKDLAKSLFLNANVGDKFTNDLIFIFEKRNPEFMDKLFGENSSKKLLRYVAETFSQFKYTPLGVIVDIGVPLLKNRHVDIEWLNSWKEEDKPAGLSKIDSDIYKIIKSNI